MTRAERMTALALAEPAEIERLWRTISTPPPFGWVTPPVCASIVAQARVNGAGARFNLGEVVVTKCVVRLDGSGEIGTAVVPGRRRRHAIRAAVLEAMASINSLSGEAIRTALAGLHASHETRSIRRRADVAASTADLGMLVRDMDE